jgi:hypothetical protein
MVTTVGAEVALHPFPFVVVTAKLPEAETTIERVVAPVDHAYVSPAGAVSVTLPPSQNVVGPEAVIVVSGSGRTTTVVADEPLLQPFAFVTVTL